MVYAKWYFTNEAEQEEGPFNSEATAREAEVLYGNWLNNSKDTTDKDLARYKELLMQE